MYPDEFPPDQVPDLPDLPDDQGLPPGVAFSATDSQLVADSPLVTDSQLVIDSGLGEAPPEETLAVEEVRPSQSQGWTAVRPSETRIE